MKVRHLFVGDFFPVIDYSLSTREWAAHQFNRSDLGEGLALFLRREGSPYQTLDAQLFGLDPNRVYMLLDEDSRELKTANGHAICSPGKFSMDFPPNSKLYTYHPAPEQ
jgi:hypothetical protein